MVRALLLSLLLWSMATPVVADTTLEIGQAWASGDPGNACLILGERNEKYTANVGWCERHVVQADGRNYLIKPNIWVEVQRIWKTPKHWEFGIGPSYWQNTNRALAKNFNYGVMARYKFNEDINITIRHYSNAGSGDYNMGHDFIGIGYRF